MNPDEILTALYPSIEKDLYKQDCKIGNSNTVLNLNNLQNTVLITQPSSNFAADNMIIEKILKASNINLFQVSILEYMNSLPMQIADLQQSIPQNATVFFFNITPKEIGLYVRAQYNKPIHWNGIQLSFCESLELIDADKAKKMEFWKNWKSIMNF